MIKAIILDVDGVLLGTLKGVNSPYPSTKVTEYLKSIQDSGMPVALMSGKASFAMRRLIKVADLNNMHVTDAGAVIMDPIDRTIYKQHLLDSRIIKEMLQATGTSKTFWELYTTDHWYIQKGVNNAYRDKHRKHSNIIAPIEVADLNTIADQFPSFTKAMVIYSPEVKGRLKVILEPFFEKAAFQWAGTPFIAPSEMLIITTRGISKRTGLKELAEHLHINASEMLGIGDTIMDWEFLQDCGYVGVMGNATAELLAKVRNLPEDKIFQGPGVDQDGIIKIVDHFREQMMFTIIINKSK